jgi:hypothetical protein
MRRVKRPNAGWAFQRVTTHPGEVLLEEFLKPLEISQNKLAMDIHVPATRIGEIVHWAPRHHSRDFSPSGSLFRYKP